MKAVEEYAKKHGPGRFIIFVIVLYAAISGIILISILTQRSEQYQLDPEVEVGKQCTTDRCCAECGLDMDKAVNAAFLTPLWVTMGIGGAYGLFKAWQHLKPEK